MYVYTFMVLFCAMKQFYSLSQIYNVGKPFNFMEKKEHNKLKWRFNNNTLLQKQ